MIAGMGKKLLTCSRLSGACLLADETNHHFYHDRIQNGPKRKVRNENTGS